MSYTPYMPIPILFQGNSVSVTGTLVETTLASATIKSGSMGKTDYIEAFMCWSYTNVARNKTLNFKIGSSNYMSVVTTTSASLFRHLAVHNRNSLSSQVCWNAPAVTDNSTSAVAIATFTENFANDLTLAITGTLSNTADTISIESVAVILWKNPSA